MTDSQDASQLGRLTPVPLRDVWPNEAHDFTPWMLANPDVLGEVLGMDLELTEAEHPVGGFSLDLIGREIASDDRVIIENQLEASDHGHLGQLLTYASGTDAAHIVWVAQAFRDEHRAALDWLNARTDEQTRFFGVEVSAVRIGSSAPAPLLRLVAAPNDWNKIVKAAASTHEMSGRAALYSEFWGRFLDRLHAERPGWTRATKPSNANWMNLPSGTSGVPLVVNFSRAGLTSSIYFGDPSMETNAARFQALEARRLEVEATFGGVLEWQEQPGRKARQVIASWPDAVIENQDEWVTYMDWFIDSQDRLHRVMLEFGVA